MQVHRTVVRVARKEFLTPNYLRIVLKCDDIEHYKDVSLGVNNKLFIPPQGNATVEMPIYNEETRKWDIENEANRPVVRTYTHRDIDLDAKELVVDFAVHEGDSVACQWAMNAKADDQVGLAMKMNHRDVLVEAEHYLFVTDMTGIPAVSALVAQVPSHAKVTVITEVMTKEDVLPEHYQTVADLDLHWLINAHPETGSDLYDLTKTMVDLMPASHFVHITAEFTTVKKLRDYLRKEKEWTSREFYACAYWQIGKKEHEEREKRMD